MMEIFEHNLSDRKRKKLYNKRTHEVSNRLIKTTEKAGLIYQRLKMRKNLFEKKAKDLIEP